MSKYLMERIGEQMVNLIDLFEVGFLSEQLMDNRFRPTGLNGSIIVKKRSVGYNNTERQQSKTDKKVR